MTAKIRISKNINTGFMKLSGSACLIVTIIVLGTVVTRGQNASAPATLDSTHTISFTATIDTYYHKSFGRQEDSPRTSFANLPGFALGMVNLAGDYTRGKTGFVADLVIGPRGSDAIFHAPLYKNANGGGSSQFINQMYAYYNVSERVRLNAGQFNTFLGYEMISPSKNINYSTSYLFSFGPFNHTGVWSDFLFEKGWSAKVAVMNPTDYTEYNPFNAYTLGGQLSRKTEHTVTSINATYGDPDGNIKSTDSLGSISSGNALQLDFSGSFGLTEKYFLGLSTSLRTVSSGQQKVSDTDLLLLKQSGYYGAALYQSLEFSENQTIALRTEFFSEFNGGIGAINAYDELGKAHVLAVTLSGNFKKSNLTFIPELRIDKTSQNSFTKASNGKPMNHLTSVNLAVVYTLSSLTRCLK
jgi:hypothetical protein